MRSGGGEPTVTQTLETTPTPAGSAAPAADGPTAARPRVWVLTNAPSPYQAELFRAIADEGAIDLSVRYMRGADEDRLRGYANIVMRGVTRSAWNEALNLHPRALWEAAFGRYDCYVLSGLFVAPSFFLSALILTLRRKPWVMWLERPRPKRFRVSWLGGVFRTGVGRRIRDGLLGLLQRGAHRIICMGSAARSEYAERGAPAEKLLVLPYCCDVARYAEVDAGAVEQVRDRYGLSDRIVFLFSGQMIPRKGVDVLITAFSRLAEERDDVALLLLGDGPQRQEYEQMVPKQLDDCVHFAGFRDQKELPAFFGAANVFVFPSRHDGWAVVVNEACGASLPIVASRQTGAAWDLVVEGDNGFTFDAEDADTLVEHMRRLAADPATAAEFGRRSFERVQRFSVENGGRLFEDHIRAALGEAGGRRDPEEQAASAPE